MHMIESTYTHTMHNVMLDQKSDKFLQIFAVSFVFDLSKPKILLPMCQATGKIESLFSAYNSGIDEGQPKKNAEFMVLGTNVLNDQTTIPQKISVEVNGVTKSLYVYPERHWEINKLGQYKLVSKDKVTEVLLSYDNTFGGDGYAKNPQGKGFVNADKLLDQKIDLPQVEASPNSITSPYAKDVNPISFGSVRVDSGERKKHLGEYSQTELKALPLRPRLPKATQDGFFQSAPKDQQLSAINGQISYKIEGMSAKPISGKAPAYKPVLTTMGENEKIAEHQGTTDTVLLFPNQGIGIVTTRFILPTKDLTGSEYTAYMVQLDDTNPSSKRSQQENATALQHRLGEDRHLYGLKEDDLLPKSIANSSLGGEDMPSAASQDTADNMADKIASLRSQMAEANKAFSSSSSASSASTTTASSGGDSSALANVAGAGLTVAGGTAAAVAGLSGSESTAGSASSSASSIPDVQSAPEIPSSSINVNDHNISGSSLSNENYTDSNISNSDWSKVKLSSSTHDSTTYKNVDFTQSRIRTFTFQDCTFEHCNFSHALLQNTKMNNCQFTQCTFDDAIFYTTDINHCEFEDCQFVNTQMTIVEANSTRWSGGHFDRLTVEKTKFNDSAFSKVKVTESGFRNKTVVLTQCTFNFCDVTQSSFAHSQWHTVKVTGGVWKSNDFGHASFKQVTFNNVKAPENSWVNLQLTDSKLSNTDFKLSNWTGLKSENSTMSLCKTEDMIMAYANLPTQTAKA